MTPALRAPNRDSRRSGQCPARCYNSAMKSRLSDVNPHLRDPAKRERAVLKSVASSSAIEGIHVSLKKPLNGAGKPASPKSRVKP